MTATLPPAASLPDAAGHFGPYGGRFVPEALIAALDELTAAHEAAKTDPVFTAELDRLLTTYAGRPTPLTDARRLSEHAGGARILLKREDLAHTGSHKINNVLGQALLTQQMGKQRVIAETGAGQHGVATATACALFGFDCTVYMGEEDTRRQALNVARMRLLGAEVVPVTTTAWPWATAAGGLLLTLAGLLTVVRGPSWPALGQRYEAPATPAPTAPASQEPTGPLTEKGLWEALDRGEDPTASLGSLAGAPADREADRT